jgi:hypothetical protein
LIKFSYKKTKKKKKKKKEQNKFNYCDCCFNSFSVDLERILCFAKQTRDFQTAAAAATADDND